MLDLKTASTTATSISLVHAKLDYCNSLFLNTDITQISRLQSIQNALARAVTKTPKHHHITSITIPNGNTNGPGLGTLTVIINKYVRQISRGECSKMPRVSKMPTPLKRIASCRFVF